MKTEKGWRVLLSVIVISILLLLDFDIGILKLLISGFPDQIAHAADITDAKKATPQEVSAELRKLALATKVSDLAKVETVGEHGVYGVLMETGYPEGVVTLATFITGDASLYFSGGGGMIGGIDHETIRKTAIAFNRKASEFVSICRKTTSFPMPNNGRTIFYILTKEGIYTAEAIENDLGNNISPLSPLFYAGQNVITECRLVEETKN